MIVLLYTLCRLILMPTTSYTMNLMAEVKKLFPTLSNGLWTTCQLDLRVDFKSQMDYGQLVNVNLTFPVITSQLSPNVCVYAL